MTFLKNKHLFIKKQKHLNQPRHRGLGEEWTTSVHSFGRAQDRTPPPTNYPAIANKDRNARRKFGDDTERRPVNDHIDARAGVFGLDSIQSS